jgi:single-strand DNA-binding protein
MYNKVILVGNLTRDVNLRYLPSGSAVGDFGLATNRRWKDKQTNEDKQEVMFIDISVFGRSAEVANQYLKKGSKVLVEGRLALDTWTDQNGNNRSKHKIIAESYQFLDAKGENSGNNYNNSGANSAGSSNSYSQPSQPPRQQAPQQSAPAPMPEIDIDNEDIPF